MENAVCQLFENKDPRLVSILRKDTGLDRKEVLFGIENMKLLQPSRSKDSVAAVVRSLENDGKKKKGTKREPLVPGLPAQSQLELPLLQAILKRGGTIVTKQHLREIVEELADKFGLTHEQRSKMLQNGQTLWHNRILWTRWRLVRLGEIDDSKRGVWPLTEKGRKRAQESK